MDLKRIITTLIGLPTVILVFLFGNEYVIGGCIFIASIFCMKEYLGVIKKVCKPVTWLRLFKYCIYNIINTYKF